MRQKIKCFLFCLFITLSVSGFSYERQAVELAREIMYAEIIETGRLTLTAFHSRLPLFALIRITNLANGLHLELRITGRIEDTPDTVLLISEEAGQLLGIRNPFDSAPVRVELAGAFALASIAREAGNSEDDWNEPPGNDFSHNIETTLYYEEPIEQTEIAEAEETYIPSIVVAEAEEAEIPPPVVAEAEERYIPLFVVTEAEEAYILSPVVTEAEEAYIPSPVVAEAEEPYALQPPVVIAVAEEAYPVPQPPSRTVVPQGPPSAMLVPAFSFHQPVTDTPVTVTSAAASPILQFVTDTLAMPAADNVTVIIAPELPLQGGMTITVTINEKDFVVEIPAEKLYSGPQRAVIVSSPEPAGVVATPPPPPPLPATPAPVEPAPREVASIAAASVVAAPIEVPPISPPALAQAPLPAGSLFRIQTGSFASRTLARASFDRLRAADFNPAFELFNNMYRVVLSGIQAADVPLVTQRLENAGFRNVWIRREN